MKESKPYVLPEDNPVMANEAIATRVPTHEGINTLRHELMDAIFATNNQQALFTCLTLLNNLPKKNDSIKDKMLNRITELSYLENGWDGENSLKIDSSVMAFAHKVILEVPSSVLKNWVLFPDARGFLYWDYTQGKNIAGITMASDKMVAFIKKNGELQKFSFDELSLMNVVKILKKTYE